MILARHSLSLGLQSVGLGQVRLNRSKLARALGAAAFLAQAGKVASQNRINGAVCLHAPNPKLALLE
jgi:hypothetical protein